MTLIRRAVPVILAALLVAPLAGPAPAGGAIEGSIEVVDPWARPSIPNRPGVAYLEIRNTGESPDRLVGARAAAAEAVELHKAEQKEGVMRMAPVEAVEVPAAGAARLAPGGFHLMLFGLETPLEAGDSLEMVLEFERAGPVTVSVPVRREAPGKQD